MAFSLIDDTLGAVPITALTKDRLSTWLETAPERERNWVRSTGFTAETGKPVFVPGENGRLGRVLPGLGDGPGAAATMWALAGLADALPEGSYRLDPVPEGAEPTRLALGWALATYAFTRYHAKPASGAALVWPAGADRGRVERLARAVFLARDLTNTPAGDLGPEELAQAAVRVAEEGGACHRVIVGDDLLAENYPTIHAVGRASTRPPRLVDLVWGDPAAPKLTLVGKGVCFDTGGLDLKPASGMRLMKKDMAGAAIVLGLAQAIMDARLPVRLRVLLPCVENSVSGNAMRPMDIIRTRKGLTVEIGNTDAEGRLILCDALAEASTETPALADRYGDPDRCRAGGTRPRIGGVVLQRRGARCGTARRRLSGGRPDVADAAVAPLSQDDRQQDRRSQQRVGRAARRCHHRRSLSAGVRRAGLPWAHLDVMAWNPQSRPGRPEGAEATALRALYAHIAQRFG